MTAPKHDDARPLWQRLIWFVALWAGGVTTVLVVASIIRLFI